jgi:hypothetical protein
MIPRETVHVVVDDATIASGDLGAVIQPVWWLSTIYNGPGMYEETLRQFSRPQRLVRALILYCYEVNNGGHEQFYSNSSGIVWSDAMECFDAIGLPRGARNLAIAARRLGGDPSLDRIERQEQLEQYHPDFEDLDEAFANLQEKTDIDEQVMTYVRSRPSDFYFSGMIERVVLPGRETLNQ